MFLSLTCVPTLTNSGRESDFPGPVEQSGGRNPETQEGASQPAGPEQRRPAL